MLIDVRLVPTALFNLYFKTANRIQPIVKAEILNIGCQANYEHFPG
jgi:hypothetical protein